MNDDVEQIKQLKARYFRYIDTKNWSGMRELVTDDFALDATGTGGEVLVGADEFIALLAGSLDGSSTAHHGHNPEIDVIDETAATGIWALADLIVFPDGTRLQGYGHYHDTYRRHDGHWQIAASTVTRLLMEATPAPAGAQQ